jgi:hypothetical protein
MQAEPAIKKTRLVAGLQTAKLGGHREIFLSRLGEYLQNHWERDAITARELQEFTGQLAFDLHQGRNGFDGSGMRTRLARRKEALADLVEQTHAIVRAGGNTRFATALTRLENKTRQFNLLMWGMGGRENASIPSAAYFVPKEGETRWRPGCFQGYELVRGLRKQRIQKPMTAQNIQEFAAIAAADLWAGVVDYGFRSANTSNITPT